MTTRQPPCTVASMTDTQIKQASVADVARMAGVSKATAARVLGGYGVASEKAREAVAAAAAQLGYRPNELARSMTTGRTDTVGVVVGDIENPFFGQAVRGISDQLRAEGLAVILANSGEDVIEEQAAIRRLLAWRVDGIIVSPASVFDTAHLTEVQQAGVPLVLLDRAIPALGVDAATSDDRNAAARMTADLLAGGYQRPVYITSCAQTDSSEDEAIRTGSVRERIEGFREACAQAGLPIEAAQVIIGATGSEATCALIDSLLATALPPDVIIASDSLVALEVFRYVRALGLVIPRDLALVTFYDADWTAVTEPPVTVIHQPAKEMGVASARLLSCRLRAGVPDDRHPPEHIVVPSEIRRRGSH